MSEKESNLESEKYLFIQSYSNGNSFFHSLPVGLDGFSHKDIISVLNENYDYEKKRGSLYVDCGGGICWMNNQGNLVLEDYGGYFVDKCHLKKICNIEGFEPKKEGKHYIISLPNPSPEDVSKTHELYLNMLKKQKKILKNS